jgi:membrane protein
MVEFGNDDATTMAAGVAYYVFLSIFPLILGAISILGYFLPSTEIQDQLFNFFRENIPGAVNVLQANIERVMSLRGTLGILGIIGLLWAGSGALAAIGHAINVAWDIPREMQFYWKKMRDIGLTIGLGLLFIISLGFGVVFNIAQVRNIPVIGLTIVQIGLRIIAFLLALTIFLILFKIIPNTRTYWRHIWFGALVTAVLFEIGRSLTFLYLTSFSNYQLVYGSIASVIVLLIWIYYSAIIVVLDRK